MTDPTLQPADRPSPAGALESVFRGILAHRMHDMPMVNAALSVEAVGFRPWRDHWLGILVTPWFMNLVLLPRVTAKWLPLAERESRHHAFPAGVFEFIGAADPALGDYQACSLFSPMFEFADHAAAHATAVAALDAMFDAANREAGEPPAPHRVGAAAEVGPVPVPPATSLDKRAFLFGRQPRAERGP